MGDKFLEWWPDEDSPLAPPLRNVVTIARTDLGNLRVHRKDRWGNTVYNTLFSPKYDGEHWEKRAWEMYRFYVRDTAADIAGQVLLGP